MFRELKKRFNEELVLAAYTLDYVTVGVLSIEYKDEQWRPVAYLSKSLNKTERNYKIHDKKILAVIRELENQRYLLKGIKFKFKV